MSVSSASSPRAFSAPISLSNEKIRRADSATLVSSESSCTSTSETQSIEESDSARPPPAFQLLFVTGPGTSRKFVYAQESKCRSAGVPVTMVGDGQGSITQDLLDLKLDKSVPTLAIYFAHGNVDTDHLTWLDDDDLPVATTDVLKLLHQVGVLRVTVFSCYAGAGAKDVGPELLTDVGGLKPSYLFMGRDDYSTNKYINRDDIDELVDYLWACALEGTAPDGLNELLVMAQISPQTLRYVQASTDDAGSPVIVHVPAVHSGPADGKLRIQNATVQADSRRECQVVRSVLDAEFQEFESSAPGDAVIKGSEALMPRRALNQQIFDGNRAEVLALMSRGVKPDWNGQDTLTPLQMAAFGKSPRILASVLEQMDPSQIEETARVSVTPLAIAVSKRRKPNVKLLLAHRANPDLYSSIGTPLTNSLRRKEAGIAEALLNHKADANLPDQCGLLPLEIAVAHNDKRMALRLLKAGATPAAIAIHGDGTMVGMGSGKKTALEKIATYAFWAGERKIASMLRKLQEKYAAAVTHAGIPG